MNKRESKVTPDGLLTLGAELDVVDQGKDKDSSMLARDHRVTGASPREHIVRRKTTRDPDIFER